MTSEDVPSCACTAHPKGDDKKKFMVAVEETQEHVVWCCRRCTEITRTAVIQVRTLPKGKARAKYQVDEKRRNIDPRLLELLHKRTKGRINMLPKEKRYA